MIKTIQALLVAAFVLNSKDIAAAEVLVTSFSQADLLQYSHNQVANVDGLVVGGDADTQALAWVLGIILINVVAYLIVKG